jgi:hypothetical protein
VAVPIANVAHILYETRKINGEVLMFQERRSLGHCIFHDDVSSEGPQCKAQSDGLLFSAMLFYEAAEFLNGPLS